MKEIEVPITTPTNFYLKFHSPVLLTGKGPDSVRFTLTVTHDPHGDLFSIPGWRIMNGQVLPPARKIGKFKWVPNVEINNVEIVRQLFEMLNEDWEEAFPSVQFPTNIVVNFKKEKEKEVEEGENA